MKDICKIILIFALLSSFNSIDEIKYSINRGFLGRLIDTFSVTFNRISGIQAEYSEANSFNIEESKGKKIYNLTTEELGLPSLKELFKLFNKIDFPEETDWMQPKLFDVPIWYLYVDDKDYHSNRGTEFLEEFAYIVNLTNIKKYCKDNY